MAMPQTMPSMVSALRVRLRRRAVQASLKICKSIVPQGLKPQFYCGSYGTAKAVPSRKPEAILATCLMA